MKSTNVNSTDDAHAKTSRLWPEATKEEERVSRAAEILGLSLHRCSEDHSGIHNYGLFDELGRLADPAITHCAPLDWIEAWLDEHKHIQTYVAERNKRVEGDADLQTLRKAVEAQIGAWILAEMEGLEWTADGLEGNRTNTQAGICDGMAHGLFDDFWELYLKIHPEQAQDIDAVDSE